VSLEFEKWHGIGNDFVLLDGVPSAIDSEALADLALELCHRTFGVGADGLLVALPSEVAAARMVMLNPDGSEAEMCGNGLRCFARWWHLLHGGESRFDIETGAGLRSCLVDGGLVEVDMGRVVAIPGLEPVEVEGQTMKSFGVDVGNPHLVVFLPDDREIDLAIEGAKLERHSAFPNRVNVHFVSRIDGGLRMQTWERGAGITMACGTGACAVAFAARSEGWSEDSVAVQLPGGRLAIRLVDDRVLMRGPAERSFVGRWIGFRGGWPDES
jgi:diaminopimelate epimerase